MSHYAFLRMIGAFYREAPVDLVAERPFDFIAHGLLLVALKCHFPALLQNTLFSFQLQSPFL